MKLPMPTVKLNITRRWHRARPGSVLILVVALLVLLALIGTAYLSSTQTERYTSNQNSINTEADLLLQGMINAVSSNLSNAVFGSTSGGTQFRPAQPVAQPAAGSTLTGYNPYTSASTDLLLGDRMPSAAATWSNISWPLFTNLSGYHSFDSPSPSDSSIQLGIAPNYLKQGTGPYTIGYKPFSNSNPTLVPAFSVGGVAIMAADTDGDGIADAGFVKLPIGPINGITYYVASRVVDDNSAINVNTALSNLSDFATSGGNAQVDALGVPAGTAALGFFPSHVGLMPILPDYAGNDSPDMENVLRYLNGQSLTMPAPLASANYAWADADPDSTPSARRADFNFLTVGDHLNSQIVRRINNAGYYTYSGAPVLHASFGMADTAALAYRFCLHDLSLTSDVETQMPDSLNSANTRTIPFSPTQALAWYNYLTSNSTRMRPLLVTYNPISDFISPHYVVNTNNSVDVPNSGMLPYNPPIYDSTGGTVYQVGSVNGGFVKFIDTSVANQPYRCYEALKAVATKPLTGGVLDTVNWRLEEAWTDTPVKTSINTADFPTLWRAFYNVFADGGDSIPPLPGGTTAIAYTSAGWGPFRSPVRSPAPATANTLTSGQTMQLRAAIASINAMDMRDADDDVTSRTITLYTDSTHTVPQFTATVYGVEKQPFIVTVVADYNGTKTTDVSIELYNPTDTVIDVSNWQIGTINRTPGVGGVMSITAITGAVVPALPAGTTIPAGGYLLIQSQGATNMTAGVGESIVTVVGLETTADPANPTEVVFLRPRRADNTYSVGSIFDNTYNEGSTVAPNYDQMVPVDSIDFTGVFSAGAAGTGRRIYERAHGYTSDTVHYNWDFIHPGKYDAVAGKAGSSAYQAGWSALAPPAPAAPNGATASDGTTAGGSNPVTYQPIQLATSNWVGPHRSNVTVGNSFPFGAFARNGDMLKVPYIGAYVIRASAGIVGQFLELNSITMDASQATASPAHGTETPELTGALGTDTVSDEAIGRFCPLACLNPTQAAYKGTNNDPYGWASHYFDYLDIQAASDDFMPNVDPRLNDGSMPSATNIPTAANPLKYTNSATATAEPVAVANTSATSANGTPEQALGKQGLININTAPLIVLEQLPGVDATMAANIITYRQSANGPFKTIFDLNQATAFQTCDGTIKVTPGSSPTTTYKLSEDPGPAQGDFTPGIAGQNDGVRGDFEEMTLMLSRISNLITTRSDTFTCYVLLQGWRNVGTSNPTLAVQRRAAFLVDRNSVTPSNNIPTNFKVPSD